MYFNFSKENEDKATSVIRSRKRKIYSSFTLRLTSMIDMFTILLVFLLHSFSAEGEIISVSKDLRLPKSTAETPPKATPILVVTNEWIILDGKPVEKMSRILGRDKIIIDNLKKQLSQIRSFSESLGSLDAKMGFKGRITIQGDREIPFEVLKKIMYTCGQMGFNNMLLAVHKEERI
ncbi:biopolymer transporter ExbD [candidate division KSB1 bacterium]|nr:biopolymer transporter ExbD [candidate division KSB1 bacterium]NIR71729.1 biopolymer transporter ExbD [candidate division KSB1 bacterium]NIS26410.1 biopolymer transporter ExbD [candidate division KSB1 bacterium]NIT73169.1 biopolymer transporter ExbD [candidate division KSB1 bacterium]NIU27096.1 biopolymer transporter ExbD [candidate division KSB1 bacterium]